MQSIYFYGPFFQDFLAVVSSFNSQGLIVRPQIFGGSY